MAAEIVIIADGVPYQDFTNIEVTKSIEDFAGKFHFQSTDPNQVNQRAVFARYPLRVGMSVQIQVHGQQVLDGYIEKLSINYDVERHSIKIVGRERTADLCDSTVSDEVSFTGTITLKKLIESVLFKYFLNFIKVIDENDLKPFTETDGNQLKSEFGTTVFDALEKYAQQRQVLLTTNEDSNIVLLRSPSKTYKTLLSLSGNSPAIILSGNIVNDDTKRFNKYDGKAAENPLGIENAFVDPKKIAGSSKLAQEFDFFIRKSRIYHFQPSAVSANETLQECVKWESNFRTSQAQQWNYTLQGHLAKDDNKVWLPGYLVNVQDVFTAPHALLLISGVTYTYNLGEGSKTTLKLVTQESFSTEVKKPIKQAQSNDQGIQKYFSVSISQIGQGGSTI